MDMYSDLNGFVGEPDVPVTTPGEDADAACGIAYAAADKLATVLDRRDGDAGEHADALLSIAVRIDALTAEAAALLGRPARIVRDARGAMLGVVR